MEKTENVDRALNNFSRVPTWNTTMNKDEVEYLFNNYPDTVFCNGSLRQINATPITDNLFKVYTTAL